MRWYVHGVLLLWCGFMSSRACSVSSVVSSSFCHFVWRVWQGGRSVWDELRFVLRL
ncbi:hypothetical protein M758_3G138700 [Ceratodon purpureus]|nr:hypothetical protein M758_3G138700 [Ceratodon purpureus]